MLDGTLLRNIQWFHLILKEPGETFNQWYLVMCLIPWGTVSVLCHTWGCVVTHHWGFYPALATKWHMDWWIQCPLTSGMVGVGHRKQPRGRRALAYLGMVSEWDPCAGAAAEQAGPSRTESPTRGTRIIEGPMLIQPAKNIDQWSMIIENYMGSFVLLLQQQAISYGLGALAG